MTAYRVADSADVDDTASIGAGTSVWHLAQVRGAAVIGEQCIVGRGAYVGSGVRIGDRVKIQNYALVYEPAIVEDGVLGAAYRGGVMETAFSGVFATVQSLEGAGAEVVVHDPMYDDEELRALGFEPHHLGDPVDAAIVQTDHEVYADLGLSDLPGLRFIYDGRRAVDVSGWHVVGAAVIGVG